MKIISTKDYNDMSRKAANILSAHVILHPRSVLGLATGSTPLGMYRQLIDWYKKGDVDFSGVSTFNLDEYLGMGKQDVQSYFYFMCTNFFDHINIDARNIEIPDGMADSIAYECRRYDQKIEKLGGIDLQVLGIGVNGHIGFNEPAKFFERNTHQVMLSEDTRRANARFFESMDAVPRKAISMGIGTIMHAKKILLLCSGEHKAQILHRAFYKEIDPGVPAAVLQLHSDITIVADTAALKYF